MIINNKEYGQGVKILGETFLLSHYKNKVQFTGTFNVNHFVRTKTELKQILVKRLKLTPSQAQEIITDFYNRCPDSSDTYKFTAIKRIEYYTI